MRYKLHKTHHWQDPTALLSFAGNKPQFTFLYTANSERDSGKYSYLAWQPAYVKSIFSFDDLPSCDESMPPGFPQWMGYISYEMGDMGGGKNHAITSPAFIPLARCQFIQYAQLLRFDHANKQILHYVHERADVDESWVLAQNTPLPLMQNAVTKLTSNMTHTQYLQCVEGTKAQIYAGNFYQANITRKFYGACENILDAASLFAQLNAISPAPYSACIKLGAQSIISSSPECLLKIDENQQIYSHPIKGSIKREGDEVADKKAQKALQSSAKDQAENLMIVDLMRHDFSQICEAGSVKVAALSQLKSYSHIHHLVSSIEGKLKAGLTHSDILKAIFPAGSMTGAPKRAAMNWCAQQEKQARGVYSGAIGWLGAQNSAEFSVVIRTLMAHQNQFEFQVGGGIVADSEPQAEWLETLTKAAGIAKLLGIDIAQLEAL
jgi:anthranilate/para-aminobenzoate synthase component I